MFKQFGSGYIIERVTESFEQPNPEFANDPQVREDRERHDKLRDRLIAVHRLRATAKPLSEIIGLEEFNRLQDVWSTGGNRRRWSVAFPIVESYKVVAQPQARTVFEPALYRRLYQSQSATLRPFDDAARAAIAELEIIRVDALNSWIAIEDEIKIAERSEVSAASIRTMDDDLQEALEGVSEERWR